MGKGKPLYNSGNFSFISAMLMYHRDMFLECGTDTYGQPKLKSLYVRGLNGELLKEKRIYTENSTDTAVKYYYYPDRIGNVFMVCDENGIVLEKDSADEFGAGRAQGISRHGLSSNMYDADTGLYYFHARWYDPETGRFMEMDPVLTERGLWNMYDYCNSNPVSLTDRHGEFLPFIFGVAVGMWIYDVIDTTDKAIKEFKEGRKDVSEVRDEVSNSASSVMSGMSMGVSSFAPNASELTGKGAVAINVIALEFNVVDIWADKSSSLGNKIKKTTRTGLMTGAGILGGVVGAVGGGLIGSAVVPVVGTGLGVAMFSYYGAGTFMKGMDWTLKNFNM